MARPDAPPRSATAQLLPAGRRWGTGVESIAPYLRDAWSERPRNPVFTPGEVVSLAWPARMSMRPPQAKP